MPLSYAQERVWFMDQLAPGEAAYHIAVPLRVRGPLDVAALRRALADLTRRHETLRTRFPADPMVGPPWCSTTWVEVPLTVVDAADEGRRAGVIDRAAAEPFDLANGPLLRALLIRLTAREHVLLLGQHHIVGDGWSVDVLLRDLIAATVTGSRPALPVQYGDFAVWEARELAAPGTRGTWTGGRTGSPASPRWNCHWTCPARPTQTYRGDFVEFTVDAGSPPKGWPR